MVSAAARRSFEISWYSGDVTHVVNVSRSGKAMRTTVLDEDRHECRNVALAPFAIVNGELSNRVDRYRATVPAAPSTSVCAATAELPGGLSEAM